MQREPVPQAVWGKWPSGDVVARSQLADGVAAEHAAELVGRDRQVLAIAEPGFDLVTEPRLLEFCDDRAEAALTVAPEHLVQHGRQHGCAELAERAPERRVVLQGVQDSPDAPLSLPRIRANHRLRLA